jgi:IS30 family transposase
VRITKAQASTIRQLHSAGSSKAFIAKKLGVSEMTVFRYTSGRFANKYVPRAAGRKRGRPRKQDVVTIVHNHNKLGPSMKPALRANLTRAVASLIRMLPDEHLIDLVAQDGEGRSEELRVLAISLREK